MPDNTTNTHRPAARASLYMLLLVWFPLAYILLGAWITSLMSGWPLALGMALAWLYILPPLLCQLSLKLLGRPISENAAPGSRAFRHWWFLTQLQMIFNRISLLEDLLRLIPGAYGIWLSLWGSRVSPLAYWAKDVLITERYLLDIGPGVVLASYSALSAHLLTQDEQGRQRLIVAPIKIDAGAMIGIRAGIGPGCHIYANETLPAARMLPPFSGWREGRKFKLEADISADA